MKKYIFITHSSHDATTATKIRDYLETNGIQCWMAPRDIPVGEEWAEAILEGIENASGMLLVFSSNSNNSPQVRREIERAIHNNIPIFPVRIEDVVPSKAMEYYISSNHWMDAFGGNFETNLDKLVAAIKSKHNITLESEPEPTSKPIKTKEQSPSPTSQVTDKSSKRKLTFPRVSFKMPKKILFPIVFLLLLVAGYFISKSFENSNPDTITAEEIAPLPSDTINTFVRMIASTDEFDDYVSDIKVTEDGNYVIMGYSYVNEFEGKPWIAMFDSLGNELWKREGSIDASENGAFDIFPDGRSVWAYPMEDSTLINNSGETNYLKEYLSDDGEVILSQVSIISNSNTYFGCRANLPTRSTGIIKGVFIASERVYVTTESSFTFLCEYNYRSREAIFEEGSLDDESLLSPMPWNDYFCTEYSLDNDRFTIASKRRLLPFQGRDFNPYSNIANIQIINNNLYSAILCGPNITLQFQLWSQKINKEDSLLLENSEQFTYRYQEQIPPEELQDLFLILNDVEEFYLITLLPDNDIYCLKLSVDGNDIWLKKFETRSNSDNLLNATFIDNAVFLCGSTYSIETESYDGYLMKMDVEGNILWERTYNFEGCEDLWGVEGTEDGGLVLVLESDVHGTSDVFLLKADSLGNIPKYCADNSILLFENWSLVKSANKWINSSNLFWSIDSQPEFGEAKYLSISSSRPGFFEKPISIISGVSFSAMMGSLGYVGFQSTTNYIRYGLWSAEEVGKRFLFTIRGLTEIEFPYAEYYDGEHEKWIACGEKAWIHWDYSSNSSFETCGRIGVGFFNGDSIVVGKIAPDTAWVEYGVLNDFEIKLDGNTADYFINDSLFFHTDEFVCESDSLYLYLGGASSIIRNAIGEVRVTSE